MTAEVSIFESPLAVKYAETIHMRRSWKNRILLVEDDQIYRHMVVAMLERMGCSVTEAVNGNDAIRAAGDERFDLCLIDLGLPDMSGIDVASQLQLAYPKMNIALYSGSTVLPALICDAHENGFITIGKPLRPQNILCFLNRPVTIQ